MKPRFAHIADTALTCVDERFLAIILHEDEVTLERVERICEHLVGEFEDTPFDCYLIRFDELSDLRLAQVAAALASQADLVVFSAHAGRELPDATKNWIETWLPTKNLSDSALAALVGLPEDEQKGITPIHVYLREIAARGHMQFLSQVITAPGEVETFTRERLLERRETITPTLRNLLQTELIPQHWGINE